MKVLSAKLEDFASMSLSQTPTRPKRSTAGVARTRGTGNLLIRRDEPSGKPDTMFQYLGALEPQDIAGENRGSRRHELARLYWTETMKFQGPIQMILGRLLLSLRGVKRHKAASTTSYELCARLYQTGFHNFRGLVFQDLNGEYFGSSKEENITIAQSVFEVLNSAVNGIVKPKSGYQGRPDHRQSLGPSPDGLPQRVLADRSKISHRRGQFTTVGTFISWSYTSDVLSDEPQSKESKPSVIPITNDRPKSHDIRSLNETITVMVPLVMSNPIVIGMITEFVGLIVQTSQAISDNTQDQVEVAQGTKFTASFSLTTQGYVESWKKSRHSASSQLSKAPMGRDKLFSGNTSEDILKGPLALDLPTAIGHSERGRQTKDEQERYMKWERGIGDVKRRMNEWVFEETGVRVSCGLYVWSVLTIATTLVAGGIASGLTIQERMPGVDPFNIATFSWVVAGFIILIAKSARVGDWSWRDFLQRQVLCRSVSELHHVTGIDSQLIIAKLIHDESSNRLRTRGPYNCVFTRRTEILEGFSIDRPVSVDTMLLSGLIMVQVQAPYYGEFLVCLDVRKGTAVHSIKRNSDPTEEKSYIASNTVPNFSLSQSESPRVSLCRGKPHWRQVIGIYGRRDCLSI
ncbi:hypothetical protein NUW58_g1964 [Xylaria curta]|nr:hypothetical protein NUW58_g1964 [Xylaria curta]